LSRLKSSLPEGLAAEVKANIADWQSGRKMQRLWRRDATLWTGDDESRWLGWLDIAEYEIAHPVQLRGLAKEVWSAGFKDILLLGMGGSSLCPEVLRMTFGQISGFPKLHVLDSTDPAQVKAFEDKIDVARTLFIVSSKSGSTLEPDIFRQYFFERVKQTVGAGSAGSHFIAITDPGSHLHKVAEEDHFRLVYFGRLTIGGRYSALSNFGMIPAAVMGIDTKKFLDRTQEMVRACGPESSVEENPGAILGIILGTAAKSGRDKVTFITSPDISDLGAWLEQLLAESTGKVGKGIIPIDREELGAPEIYGRDRVFAYVHTEHATDVAMEQKIAALEKAGHPVVRISMADIYDLGAEFFRWEIATAVAGSIVGINAFNQPDVETSKVVTRQLTSEYEKTGSLPAEAPLLEDQGLKLFTDQKNAAALAKDAGEDKSLAGYLKAHLNRISAGDYFALLAYVPMNTEHEKDLQAIRYAVRDTKQVATCLGFGPRFLHSTGQAYKGGPNSGVFLQITCDDAVQLPVPGEKYTFGIVKAAQARGDFQVLAERGRRALHVHLPADVAAGLARLNATIQQVCNTFAEPALR
jgi:transaldolase / glucose-6-phosphate isomerase